MILFLNFFAFVFKKLTVGNQKLSYDFDPKIYSIFNKCVIKNSLQQFPNLTIFIQKLTINEYI